MNPAVAELLEALAIATKKGVEKALESGDTGDALQSAMDELAFRRMQKKIPNLKREP